jgi:hypothetical protein
MASPGPHNLQDQQLQFMKNAPFYIEVSPMLNLIIFRERTIW